MGYKTIECENLEFLVTTVKFIPSKISCIRKLPLKEKKQLVDSLVDPIFVISNANNFLKQELEKFVSDETKEYFHMIDRAQKRIMSSVDQLRDFSAESDV